MVGNDPVAEDALLSPISPYGRSKLMSEWMLEDTAAAFPLRYVALRYFNVAGADPKGRTGQSTTGATHLIKVAAQTALGQRQKMDIFGTDYPTPDGTGVRDYIHVTDLAEGHVAALRWLLANTGSLTVNLGTGQGYSVLDLVRAYEAASGRSVPYELVARRPGDVAACWADPTAARETLGWSAKLDLARMCEDSWRWQHLNPHGFNPA
eukprot:gene46871-57388_t